MAAESLEQLFIEELRDTYDAEKRLIKALPKMAKAAQNPALQKAFMTHLRETERQVARLEQVFRSVGQPARGKKCDGMMGIIEENSSMMEELDGAVLDAALISGAQKAEHYEIASYGTLAYFAELLGNTRAKDLLGETLEEEKATDEKLNALAKSEVNREALLGLGDEQEEEEEEEDSSPMRRGRGGAASMSMAQDEASRRGSRSGRSSSSRRGSSRGRSGR
jgi:ferritin-like metal-binding protein YciE